MSTKFNWDQFDIEKERPSFDWDQFETVNQENDFYRGLGNQDPNKPFLERGLVGSIKRGGQGLVNSISEGYDAGKEINAINTQRHAEGKPEISAKETGVLKFLQGMVDPKTYADLLSAATEEENGEKRAAIIPNQLSQEYMQQHRTPWISPEGQKGPATAYSDYIKSNLDLSPEQQELFEKQEKGVEGTLQAAQLITGLTGGVKGALAKANAAPKSFPRGPTIDVTLPKVTKNVPATMESGLTKPRALEAKRPGFGIVSPERQQKVISGLNKEASELAKKHVEKTHPVLSEVEGGKDVYGEFDREFSHIRSLAEKYNPEIDITPVSQLLSKQAKEYRGIPKLHDEGAKVMREIQAFREHPQTGMGNLLKIYRSNNRKLQKIYEQRLLHGKQREYADFLTGMNKSIAESFEKTLPQDSAWLKNFRDWNSRYSQFKDALKTQAQLRPIIGGDLTKSNVNKFTSLANDPMKQAKLRISMGKESADRVIQVAKDLRDAIAAIKKIPAREWKTWQKALPASFALPGVGKVLGLKSIYDWARRGYGHYLSSPEKIRVFDKALRAIAENNPQKFKITSDELMSPEQGKRVFEKHSPKELDKGSAQGEGRLKDVIEVDPDYTSRKYLDEPVQYLRKRDVGEKGSYREFIRYKKEWDKYLNPELFDDYYLASVSPDSYPADWRARSIPITKNFGQNMKEHIRYERLGDLPFLGTVGDLFKGKPTSKHLKDIKDIPIIVNEGQDSMATLVGGYDPATKEYYGSFIRVRPGFTPQQLRSSIAHEGIHGLQRIRINPKTGFPRLNEREKGGVHQKEPYKDYEEYLKNLNEVNARKFQRWVDRSVNQYRSAVEKTKAAKQLWEQQLRELEKDPRAKVNPD